MSMPIIKPSKINRCEAITDIIESVALEQTGLSHILNAEGEKIQAALILSKDKDDLLKINKSVQSMINSITRLETILQGKLELFNDCLCECCPVTPCKPSMLKFEFSNPKGGNIVNGDVTNTYLLSGTEEGTDIKFITNPEVIVTSSTVLPTGITFQNNTLTIPAKFDWSKVYTMKFFVGTDNCKYEITIITAVI
jgi:hypothetical protein